MRALRAGAAARHAKFDFPPKHPRGALNGQQGGWSSCSGRAPCAPDGTILFNLAGHIDHLPRAYKICIVFVVEVELCCCVTYPYDVCVHGTMRSMLLGVDCDFLAWACALKEVVREKKCTRRERRGAAWGVYGLARYRSRALAHNASRRATPTTRALCRTDARRVRAHMKKHERKRRNCFKGTRHQKIKERRPR